MPDIDLLFLLRSSHVMVGIAGLVLVWIPVFALKGGRLHTRCGRLFAYCAFYGGGTGLLFSCWALIHPWSFFGESEAPPTGSRAFEVALADTRFLYSITGFLALGVLAGTYLGIRFAQAKSDHARLRSPLVLGALGAFGLWSVVLALHGAWNLFAPSAGLPGTPSGAGSRHWLSIVLGLVGAWGVLGDFKYIFRAPTSPHAWRYQHMECMLGSGIGFHAAALFFIGRWLELPLEGAWQLAPLLVPLAIGAPMMWIWIAREERRLESDAAE